MTPGSALNAEQIADLAAEIRRQPATAPGVEQLGAEATMWLALPPSWTAEAAERAKFPSPVDQFVRRAAQASILELHESITEDGGESITFWPRASARESLLAGCVQRFGLDTVQQTAATIAGRLLHLEDDGCDIGTPVHDWAELVAENRGNVSGEKLVDRVRAAVARDDLARAMETLSIAEALGPLAPHLESSVVRARRLVYLGYRRRHDTRALASFLRRGEQVAAVRDLVHGRGDQWALHLIGMGGVGKTMLVRYLSSGLFAHDEAMPVFPVGRIDFDHLSPAYPIRRPVQLLVELADELAPFADTEVRNRRLNAFLESAVSVQSYVASRPPSDDIGDDPIVHLAVSHFAQFLSSLAQPVVLVLDTCEELAKLHPGDAEAPALARTFAMLEQVHAGAPAVRVLLAGRRHLASRGAGWELAPGSPLPPRDYLGRCELRGFTRGESLGYLAPERMPEALVEEILARSPESGRTAGIVATPGDDPAGSRHNPFDLALYRSWWQAEPELSAQRLRTAGMDAYVEVRIAGRLQDPELERVLPAVALLGRFDESMLAPVTSPGRAPAIVARLAEQEWVETTTDPDTGDRILQVEELLRPRLLVWAGRPERRESLETLRAGLAVPLAALLAEQPLDRLSADHVLAAVRLAAPVDAALIWAGLEHRIAATSRWDWARNVVPRIRAAFTSGDDAGHPLLVAGVLATEIAVRRRDSPYADNEPAWRSVRDAVAPAAAASAAAPDGEPLRRLARRLWRRAVLGVAGTRRRPSTPGELASFVEVLRERPFDHALDAAAAAALEGIAEHNDPARLAGLLDPARAWLGECDLSPDAAAAVGVALATMAAPDPRQAASYLVAALETVESPAGTPEAAADLPGRPDPRVWILLHRARLCLSRRDPPDPEVLASWLANGLGQIHTIDGERLAAQCVQVELGFGLVAEERLDEIAAVDAYYARRRPDRGIHDAVPPLFVALAEGYLATGRPDRARELLEAHRRAGRSGRAEDATERAAELALVRLARRMRSPSKGAPFDRLRRSARSGVGAVTEARVCEQIWGARLLADGVPPGADERTASSPEMWLAWWSSQQVDPVTGRIALPAAAWALEDGPDQGSPPALRVAVEQALTIGEGPGRNDLRAWLARHEGDFEQPNFRFIDPEPLGWVGAALGRPGGPRAVAAPPVAVAEAALAAGELLAFRQPAAAKRLLDVAIREARGRSPLVAFQAAVCGATATGHLGHAAAADASDLLSGCYEDFRRHFGDQDLPDWVQVRGSGDFSGVWRPWLDRCRVAAIFADGGLPEAPPGPRTPELRPALFRPAFTRLSGPRVPIAPSAPSAPSTATVTAVTNARSAPISPPPAVSPGRDIALSAAPSPAPAAAPSRKASPLRYGIALALVAAVATAFLVTLCLAGP
ncbi:MAG TPA: AAA family ATPase, partial [Actinoplanes sp.]|nr:AAA family ATPase [Actinoplanes sp.]